MACPSSRAARSAASPALSSRQPSGSRSIRPSSSADRLAPSSHLVMSTRGVAAYTAGTVTLVRPCGSRTPAARASAITPGAGSANAAAAPRPALRPAHPSGRGLGDYPRDRIGERGRDLALDPALTFVVQFLDDPQG